MRFAVAFVVSVAVSAVGVSGYAAFAKPKKAVSMGCTAEQLQTPEAGACIRKMEQDILNNRAYLHFVMCDETGTYCCQGDDKRTFGCKSIRARLPGGTVGPGSGGLSTKR